MYDRIMSDFKLRHPGFPVHPAPEVGIAIKQIRLRMGFTQGELAQNARIKLSALKTLEKRILGEITKNIKEEELKKSINYLLKIS